jgi:ABC-2 type transport system permease protein
MVAVVSATAGCIVGLTAITFERVSMVQGLILIPLAFVGGVFVPVAELPQWAHSLSWGNPVFNMVSAVRSGFTGVSEVSAGVAFAAVAALGAVLVFIASKTTDSRLADRSS